jgi:acyl-CoA synthetase (AMP-forming)/AMP-acid ligase II
MTGELVHDLLDAAPPEAPAMATRGRVLRYADVANASRRIASWLRHKGIHPGDRVLIALSRPRALEVPALLYACSRIGAVSCVLHEHVVGPALRHVLADAAPALVVSDNAAVLHVAATYGVASMGPDLDADADLDVRTEPVRVDPHAPACMIYTSGSTSRPKAVVSTHRQVTFVARAIQSRLSYRPDDVIYTTQPFSFDVGLYQIFLAALSGARVWLPTPAGAGVLIISELVESAATVFPVVPAVAETLAWAVRRSNNAVPTPRLRLLTSTGAAMPAAVPAILRNRLPDLRIQLMYGLTECKRVTIMPVDGDLERPGSSGLPLPGTEVRVVDDEGRAVPTGVVGEIVVTGPHVMSGYWNQPDVTAARFRASGLHTGDFGHLDEGGFLYVQGRRDDIYKQNGFRVSATEVEAAALEVPGIRLAAVLVPATTGKDAVLVVSGTVDAESVRAALAGSLELYKIPRQCVVVADMPLNQNGKIDKKLLAATLLAPAVVATGR